MRITIGGASITPNVERALIQTFGTEFLAVIEKSLRVGYLDGVIDKMLVWLRANPDHALRRERDQTYWERVKERNLFVSQVVEHGVRMSQITRDLSSQTRTELSEAVGGQVDGDTVNRIAEIARRNADMRLYEVVERWSLDHRAARKEEFIVMTGDARTVADHTQRVPGTPEQMR